METTQRNRVRYSPETSQAIGERAAQQRQAYNAAVEFTLAHPNCSQNRLQHQLTLWRQQDPDKWSSSVAAQRPGLFKGRLAVRQFHAADANVLRECEREIKFAQLDPEQRAKAKPPRHGNNPTRDTDANRLFRSRKRPITLIIEDNTYIKRVETSPGSKLLRPKLLLVDGMTLRLAKPIPDDAKVVTAQIFERQSSVKQSRNRPLNERSYEIHLVLKVDDPNPKDLLGKSVGLDSGVAHTLTDSDEQHHDRPHDELKDIQDEIDTRQVRQQRLKPRSCQWLKEQTQLRRLTRKMSNVHDNWEHHTAKAIAEHYDVVVVEKLRHTDMRKNTRGTLENPAVNAAAKTGLNRSLAHARPGAMQAKLGRHCAKTGSYFLKVNAQYTSTTCAKCQYRHRKNRKSQALFLCGKCNHQANADVNAAWNILQRGRQIIIIYLMLCRAAEPGRAKLGRRVGIPPLDDRPGSYLTQPGAAEPQGVVAAGLGPNLQRAHAVRTIAGPISPTFG